MEIIKTRNLSKGAKTIQDIVIDGKTRLNETLTFQKMDGMYGQRLTRDGQKVYFNAEFKKDGKFYIIK